jgi:hypothetical protein
MNDNPELAGLSARSARICECLDLDTKDKIRAAIESGKLFPRHPARKDSNRPYGYGWTSHFEIHDWLGLPRPKRSIDPPQSTPQAAISRQAMHPINIRIERETRAAIDAAAKKFKMDKSDLMRLALKIGLRALESLDEDPQVLVMNAALAKLSNPG